MERVVTLAIVLAVLAIMPGLGLLANFTIYWFSLRKRKLTPQEKWRSINLIWSIYLVSFIVNLVIGVVYFGK